MGVGQPLIQAERSDVHAQLVAVHFFANGRNRFPIDIRTDCRDRLELINLLKLPGVSQQQSGIACKWRLRTRPYSFGQDTNHGFSQDRFVEQPWNNWYAEKIVYQPHINQGMTDFKWQ